MGGRGGTQTVHTTLRLKALRDLMNEHGVDVYVVPSEDQHSSEYLASCDERRAFISGFNGSAGCAIVTADQGAFLFTDGRYFLQAEAQLDENWTLMKQGIPDVPTWQEFLHKKLEKVKIGIDPTLISASDAETITKSLTPKSSSLVSLPYNLVDKVWSASPPSGSTEKWSVRPERPANPVFHLDEKYTGASVEKKIKSVRDELKKKVDGPAAAAAAAAATEDNVATSGDVKAEKQAALVVNMLDEVAWLFNLRGSDIDYNPVFFAYAVVTPTKSILFVNKKQLEDSTVKALADDAAKVEIRPYEAFWDYLKGDLKQELGLVGDASSDAKVIVPESASLAVAEVIGKNNLILTRSPVTELKAIKNAVELEGFRQSHIRDGAALARYFAWLEETLVEAKQEVDEVQVGDVLEGYRKELDLFKGLSFPTISGTGPNGAIIHYRPLPGDCAVVKRDQVYLCDSGAQFLDGTTDVTRTWHFGSPSAEEKRAFTRVLQGHIAIDAAVFPVGTTGYLLDSWARRYLWEDGLDYRHGTGHGVGHFLNVHEGPQAIGMRITANATALKPGMTLSNEPGYYADGAYGIRIENIVLVKEVKLLNNFGDKGWLGFEHVTLSPMHKNLIDTGLLTEKEKTWINEYHAEVWEKVSPLLSGDDRAARWLRKETTPL